MTTKKRKPIPNWDSIKKYVNGLMVQQRAWTEERIEKAAKAERVAREEEISELIRQTEALALEAAHHRNNLGD